MQLSQYDDSQRDEVIALYTRVFADAEGEAEGQLIGELVAQLTQSPLPEVIGFTASSDDQIVAAVLFSQFQLPNDQRAYLLSPMAVATTEQGQGIGQQLISHGLDQLRAQQVEVVLTYGDPAFYGQVGFMPITEEVIQAPLRMSYPHGWLAQSLDGQQLAPIPGPTACVAPLNDQQYW